MKKLFVVLAIFALVFAACGEEDGKDDDDNGAGRSRVYFLQAEI